MSAFEPFSVRVPGSTSNLGSGFDAVSAALSLSLVVEVEPSTAPGLSWPEGWGLPPNQNAIEIALRQVYAELGRPVPGLRFKVVCEIPIKRGLGSSGAAHVAGIRIAERISGTRLPDADALALAYLLEGHPENIAASFLGGWTLSGVDGSNVWAEKLPSRLECRFLVVIPELTIATSAARAILPDNYSLQDAVFNVQRCGLLVYAVMQGRRDLLMEATRDRLHQEYRAQLVPGARSILRLEGLPPQLRECLLAITVSGSGSTLLAMVGEEADTAGIGDWMTGILAAEGVRSSCRLLKLAREGGHYGPPGILLEELQPAG